MAGLPRSASEQKDAVAAASERICAHMNKDHAPSCLAYAWKLLNCGDAIAARMTSISTEGFTLSITCKDRPADPISRTYCFHTPVTTTAEAKDRLIALHNRCCRGFVPAELATVVTCVLYLLVFARLVPAVAGLPLLGKLASTVFSTSTAAGYTLAVIQFLHFLEVLYCTYMCKNLKFSMGIIATWLPLVQVFGLPVTRRLRTLHAVVPAKADHGGKKD